MPPSPLTTRLPSLLQRPFCIYSHLLEHLRRHTTGTLLRPLCLTVFLAEVGISLEMRQLTSRQPAGSEPEALGIEDEGGARRGERCREAKLRVPRAGPDVLLAAVATCGGEPPILGLKLVPTMGHLLTSCLLPWVPGKEKILLGELPTMGGPEADAGQKLGWVCNFLPYILGLAPPTYSC